MNSLIKSNIPGCVDPLSAASLRASEIEFGLFPFEDRDGPSNSGTVSMDEKSISS